MKEGFGIAPRRFGLGEEFVKNDARNKEKMAFWKEFSESEITSFYSKNKFGESAPPRNSRGGENQPGNGPAQNLG